jgi:hypothetical protein
MTPRQRAFALQFYRWALKDAQLEYLEGFPFLPSATKFRAVMEGERLTRIPAYANTRRVNYRQAHFVATLMGDGARFTKPALPIGRAFGTDLGGGLVATPLAAYLRCHVSGQ